MTNENVLTMILAGGEGKRLYPLTRDRAKPAVPFGGRYRIVDFVLNNFINSGFFKIKVLTQYKSDSLNKHITRGWQLSPFLNQYVDLVPAQMRTGNDWYRGTADAVFQNANQILDAKPDYVCVFGGDHIYKMDVSQMLDYHKKCNSDLTISAIPIPIEEASEFGIMEVDDNWKLTNFVEKPKTTPKTIPGNPKMCLASGTITSHQCDRWLRTEYDTAILRARQAANWQQFLREADVLPNLKWIPSTSPNP